MLSKLDVSHYAILSKGGRRIMKAAAEGTTDSVSSTTLLEGIKN